MNQARLQTEIEIFSALLGVNQDGARLVLQDLANEAAAASASGRLGFDQCLEWAISAFRRIYARTGDTTQAHIAACALLEARAILAGHRT